MVQTRGQQTGDQSPSGRGALRGVTAEGDGAATTVSSGNTLKCAVSAPGAVNSAAVSMGGNAGREGPVSPAGTGLPISVSVSVPRGVSAHPPGIVFQAGDGDPKLENMIIHLYFLHKRWSKSPFIYTAITSVCRLKVSPSLSLPRIEYLMTFVLDQR